VVLEASHSACKYFVVTPYYSNLHLGEHFCGCSLEFCQFWLPNGSIFFAIALWLFILFATPLYQQLPLLCLHKVFLLYDFTTLYLVCIHLFIFDWVHFVSLLFKILGSPTNTPLCSKSPMCVRHFVHKLNFILVCLSLTS
jgi:hypothetical protein